MLDPMPIPRFKIDVALLATCQALFMTGTSLLIAAAALVGLALAPSAGLATVPLGLQFLAMMLFTFPASLYMQRFGRRIGFASGAALGLLGALLAAWSIGSGSFAGLCAGTFCIGVFVAFAQYYRFAAADVADEEYRSRAISLVLAGGVIAAFAGPNLANASRDAIAAAPYAGCFVVVAGLAALTMLVLAFVRVPRPPARAGDGAARPLVEIATQPRYLTAVTGALVGYSVMNLLMTSTPLAMETRTFPFADTASVIQWHVVGMFAPSFFTGHLIRRFGTLRIMLTGAVLQAACVAVNLSGDTYIHFLLALLLLGLGWNFLFIGATTLLTETYTAREKAKAQGFNDLLVFTVVTFTATTSGYLHFELGWRSLNVGVVPFLVLVAAAIAWLSRVDAVSSERAPPARS